MRVRRLSAVVGVAGVLATTACYDLGLKTDRLVTAFNDGALDTGSGDPFLSPRQVATQLVADRVAQELGDGYFDQAKSTSTIAAWMDDAAADVGTFESLAMALDCLNDIHVGNLCPYAAAPPADASAAVAALAPATDAGAGREATAVSRTLRQSAMRGKVRSFARRHAGARTNQRTALGQESVCTGTDLNREVAAEFLDRVRFEAAVERAAHTTAGLLAQGLARSGDVEAGARRAFDNAARYMRDRGWRRSFDRKTLALVTSGGAATGVFTAGAVWAVLNVVNECMHDPACVPPGTDLRFELASGTSTGAVVDTAVDAFNTTIDPNDAGRAYTDRIHELRAIAQYFTCSGVSDLYCTRSAPLTALARSSGAGAQDSLLEFLGLAKQLRKATTCTQIRSSTNMSELILNTVDFRSGRLLSLSDQEEFSIRSQEDLVQATIASAALPVIVRPVYTLPTNPDPARPQAYLDGGIRSEIPVMAVARRGAERVLVIGSDSSVATASNLPPNGLMMAARYIDVSLDGLVETELAESQATVQALRLAEIDACEDELDPDAGELRGLCPRDRPQCRASLCRADWSNVCSKEQKPPSPPPTPGAPVKPSLDTSMEPFWQLQSIFRDPRVEPLHGYDFQTKESRRLFIAGVEAIRTSCVPIAKLLGVPVPADPSDPLRRRLAAWCSPALPANVCDGFHPVSSPGEACVVPPATGNGVVDCRANPGVP
jgi:predicted acylesterase/phospholipase RssA